MIEDFSVITHEGLTVLVHSSRMVQWVGQSLVGHGITFAKHGVRLQKH